MADETTRTTLISELDEVLKRPGDSAARLIEKGSPAALRLLAGALAGYALYGAVAGLFQGGLQMVVAAWKAPVIVLSSVGLSDIGPASPFARGLVMLEAFIGVFYMALVVSRLIGLIAAKRERATREIQRIPRP